MRKTDELDKFYAEIIASIKDQESNAQFPEFFYNILLAGDNKIYQKVITETKRFDGEWIQTLESYFPSLDRIIKNPKSALKYEEEITAIERAKKTTGASIRHLAANTHFIKEIRDDNVVIPKKILTVSAEQDYQIYENRFIMTLINRLSSFVQNRYEVIKSNYESFQRNHVNFKSNFDINDSVVDMDIDLVIKRNLDDDAINQHNLDLLQRAEYLHNLVGGFKNSPFMKLMEKARRVVPPIMKTNVILKNPDFRNAYTLWLFLDRYTILGFDNEVAEKNLPVQRKYLKNIYRLALLTYTTVVFNQRQRMEDYRRIELVTYRKKGTRVAKTHVDDVVKNPDAIRIEDNAINEYYLNQNKKVFKKRLEDIISENFSYDVALRRALNQTIDITNALYQAVFELEEEEDIFKMLIKEVNLDDKLDDAKKKARIARIIRETKEVDYNRSIRLEKKLMREIDSLNRKLIARDKQLAKDKIDERRLTLMQQERERARNNIKVMDEELKAVAVNKDELSKQRQAIQQQFKEKAKELKEKKKELLRKEKEKAANYRKREIAKLRERKKKALERAALRKKKMAEKQAAQI
ncbi:MAG TPA: hypothetical protein PLW60_05035, partial [Bacilli bacterium]|nr:hypothetical protein [Bacilli bacterium]